MVCVQTTCQVQLRTFGGLTQFDNLEFKSDSKRGNIWSSNQAKGILKPDSAKIYKIYQVYPVRKAEEHFDVGTDD